MLFSIFGIGLVFIAPPFVNIISIFTKVLRRSLFKVYERTRFALVANPSLFLVVLTTGFFNATARADFEREWLRSGFHDSDIISSFEVEGDVKQGELGENREPATPSLAAHLKWCGRCNDQTPSESGNESTSALLPHGMMTWSELHRNMQKHGIKSLCVNTSDDL